MSHLVRLLLCIGLCLQAFVVRANEVGRFELPDGRTVILDDDRTWEFADEIEPPGDCTTIQSAIVPVSICLDEAEWRRTDLGPEFELAFVAKSGDLYLGVITERIYVPTDRMSDVIVRNMQDAADLKGVRVLEESRRSIEDWEWDYIRMKAAIAGADFEYDFYFTSFPEAGSVQVLAFTSEELFDETETLREAVAEGLRIVGTKAVSPLERNEREL